MPEVLLNLREISYVLHTSHTKLKPILEGADIKPAEKKRKAHLYNLRTVLDAWYLSKKETLTFREENTRKIKAEANLKELELAKRVGELLERAEVETQAGEILSIIRNRLIALPTLLSNLVFGMDDKTKVRATIKKKIYDTLNELARLSDVAKK